MTVSDTVLERLCLVSVSIKSGKVSVSVSPRTENRMSQSRLALVLQVHFQRQKFTKPSTSKAMCRLKYHILHAVHAISVFKPLTR